METSKADDGEKGLYRVPHEKRKEPVDFLYHFLRSELLIQEKLFRPLWLDGQRGNTTCGGRQRGAMELGETTVGMRGSV